MKKGTKAPPMTEETRRKISKALKGKKKPPRTEEHSRKISEAHKGKKRAPFTEETRRKMSDARKGKGIPHTKETKEKISATQKGRKFSKDTRKKISDATKGRKPSELAKKNMSKAQKGKKHGPPSKDVRKRISAAHQGIPYDEWEDFACEKKYCPKFNEACKESNRAKYGRRCFICNKTEKANGQKLSVHHVDMDKAQGCESNWKLVPLCKHCHATTHNDELVARLGYLIKEV